MSEHKKIAKQISLLADSIGEQPKIKEEYLEDLDYFRAKLQREYEHQKKINPRGID